MYTSMRSCKNGKILAYVLSPLTDFFHIRQFGEEPLPLLCAQILTELSGHHKMVNCNRQAAYV